MLYRIFVSVELLNCLRVAQGLTLSYPTMRPSVMSGCLGLPVWRSTTVRGGSIISRGELDPYRGHFGSDLNDD